MDSPHTIDEFAQDIPYFDGTIQYIPPTERNVLSNWTHQHPKLDRLYLTEEDAKTASAIIQIVNYLKDTGFDVKSSKGVDQSRIMLSTRIEYDKDTIIRVSEKRWAPYKYEIILRINRRDEKITIMGPVIDMSLRTEVGKKSELLTIYDQLILDAGIQA